MKQTVFGKHPTIENLLCSIDGVVIIMPYSTRRSNGRGFYTQRVKQRYCTIYTDKGYCLVKNQQIRYRVHKLVLETFVGIAPMEKPYGLHINDVKDDNSIENLYWGNGVDNAHDSYRNRTRSQYNVTEAKKKLTTITKGNEMLNFNSRSDVANYLGTYGAKVTRAIGNGTKINGWSID